MIWQDHLFLFTRSCLRSLLSPCYSFLRHHTIVKTAQTGQLGGWRISAGLCRITKWNDTTESRQDWSRARVNVGVIAVAREPKLSGNKTGLNYHPQSPVSDVPIQAHSFWASSVHGHFFGFNPTTPNISFWMEALPAYLPTNSYYFSRCSRRKVCIKLGAHAVFVAL